MALDPEAMQKAFVKLLKQEQPKTTALAAKKMAEIYATYAEGASAGTYGPVALTGEEKGRLETMLRTALSMPIGAPPIVATAWGIGLQAFWAGAIFGPAAATVLPGMPIVIGGLTALYFNTANTELTCAAGMATLLDTATRTLLVIGPFGPQPVA